MPPYLLEQTPPYYGHLPSVTHPAPQVAPAARCSVISPNNTTASSSSPSKPPQPFPLPSSIINHQRPRPSPPPPIALPCRNPQHHSDLRLLSTPRHKFSVTALYMQNRNTSLQRESSPHSGFHDHFLRALGRRLNFPSCSRPRHHPPSQNRSAFHIDATIEGNTSL
jgi:hypothetical protein